MSEDLQFARLVRDLKELPREVERQLRSDLRGAVEPIVTDAKDRAAWSDRIPGAIGTRTRLAGQSVSVSIRVNAKKAPHARPIEHKGKPGNFRRPVFADAKNQTRDEWHWVNQQARPFLAPAAAAKANEAAGRLMDVVESAARRRW